MSMAGHGDASGRVRVKFCGITRGEDGLAAAAAGADAVGFVFHAASSRNVAPRAAGAIARTLPPFVTRVGVVVDPDRDTLTAILAEVRLDCLQFHGDEAPEDCRRWGLPYLRAVRMRPGVDLDAIAARYADAQALLVDSYDPHLPGGTGHGFDWRRLPPRLALPLVLAGGLTPDNVARAIEAVRPWAVDVSGGIEATPGIKDRGKMRRFIHEVLRVSPLPHGP